MKRRDRHGKGCDMRIATLVCVLALAVAAPDPALAYIGPGAGITMLGALWGVLAAIVLALAAVLAWPIRAAVRSRRRKARAEAPVPDAGAAPPAEAGTDR